MNRVLIIEDDAVARRQLVELFRLEEYEVAEAESGQAGIAAAAGAAPDLVVCDIMMPGTDGFGVLEALRKKTGTALTPFIFLTAKAGAQDVRLGMSQGADDYITKPFDPDALLASARQRITRRRLQLEEAERRATDTGMLAAAALPREMEGCLAHMESLSDALAAKYGRDPQARGIRRALQEEVKRLRRLSQRLRLYSELPGLYARRFSTDAAPTRCSQETVVEAAHAVAAQWGRIGDLEISVQPGSVPLSADSAVILIQELVDNACKFSLAPGRILLETRSERAYWKLVVADSGPGMSPQQVRNIGAFKQFWSGPERPTGIGLGLVLVQALVRLHSGEVLIESEAQSGTRVAVMVPSE
jgi:two-component system sensor histidine kinase/response regulator